MGFEPTTWSGHHFWGLDAKSLRLHFEEESVLFAAQKQVGGLGLWVSALKNGTFNHFRFRFI